MALHFTEEELAARRAETCRAMAADGLDALLIFRQESMFYLTGYDTFGYVYFQCLVMTADGRLVLLTRAPDLRQARLTSMIGDIRIWQDRDGATPADDLKDILLELGLSGKALGVEEEAYGLTGRSLRMLDRALAGDFRMQDASMLVSRQRLVKSPAEIAYVERAAKLGDDALKTAWETAGPGVFEGEILAAMQGAVFAGGGDYPGNEFIIGSGRYAQLCRYFTGRRHLDQQDQLTLEFAGVYRRYHAALMRTVPVGRATDHHRAMHAACADALAACENTVRPGNTMGTVFDAHAKVLDDAGFGEHRLNACGYSLGTTYAPNWMDWPMFYTGNPQIMAPGMVFFLHMILMDSTRDQAMTLGRTVVVTETGCRSLSALSDDLIVV